MNYKKNYDAVIINYKGRVRKLRLFKKTRSSEFANEIQHILNINNIKKYNLSNIKLQNAIETMSLIKKIIK